ncbi:MAG: chitobiase/beta-hexosaminidase C-terminal domain-containing protein, partial [Verrucomicrobiales bacterium]|nr:chitobiase/beta-hexosaminidase C-terminal domain-containing protein [Verrucomicrobiales bacterium]
TTDRDVAAGILAESFDLTAGIPNLSGGNNLLAIQGLNASASDSNFLIQPEMTSVQVLVGPPAYLLTATPGITNETGWYLDEVQDTTFSHNRGFYDTPFSVSITSPTEEAEIYYTTDNSDPSPTNGTLFTDPITISKTTVLRARAFKADWKPTNIDTHTYIFLADVTTVPKGTIPENGSLSGTAPPGWPTASVNGQAFNYGFSASVLATYSSAQLREALTQIPSISVVTQQSNLTDPSTGIYVNATGHGDLWERPASIEMLDINHPQSAPADGHGEFHENCGLRVRGGYSRNDYASKHSLRLFFSKQYGATKLRYPLYGPNGASEFDKFDLRGSQNYSWSNSSGDPNETLCRDPFSRETLGALGQQHTRSRFAHVYLNGLYWGIFEIHERASNSYGESYLGGSKDDYDVVKCGNRSVANTFSTEATDGYLQTNPDGSTAAWRLLYDRVIAYLGAPSHANYQVILGNNPDGTRNPALPVLLDVDNLIDYMMAIFYSGDGDATLSGFLSFNQPNNWFGMRDRAGQRGFTFFNHDAEHTLRAPSWSLYWTRANRPAAPSDTTGPFGGSLATDWTFWNPQRIHEALLSNNEYRLRWSDHIQRHLFNDGALTTATAKARWVSKISTINKAIRVYAARYSTTGAGEAAWLTKTNEITTKFFDGDPAALYNGTADPVLSVPRRDALLSLLAADGLVPTVAAPVFSQRGGTVPANFQLTLTSPGGGDIYYTTNGEDPRTVIAGTPSASATLYSGPLTLTVSGTVRARVLSGGVWSAIDEAFFSVAAVPASALNLVISEICYHPKDPTLPAETAISTNSDDFEFIELLNISASPVDLTGVKFIDGIRFTFGTAVLEPGQRLVLVKNSAAFQARYGTAIPIGGTYALSLSNSGETILLETANGQVLRTISYTTSAPWPGPTTDGLGFSMVLIAPETNPDHDVAANWRPSRTDTGNPGGSDGNPYVDWKSTHGISSDLGDADSDGILNLMEYALGSNPTVPSTNLLPAVQRDANDFLTLTFSRPVGNDDVRCTVQTGPDLASWSDDAILVEEVHNPADGTITATWRTAAPVASTERLFMRIRASLRTP